MPPKPKYTREQIVTAALGIVSRRGVQALTAKELGSALGMSTSPIFTVFDSMQEVQEAVKQAAMQRFEDYAHRTEGEGPLFKQIGMQMLLFAREEPRLYQLLFMSPGKGAESFDDIYARLGHVAEESLTALRQDYGLSPENARLLFEHSWIHTFGIGALCATDMCRFPREQLSRMLTQDFTAMLTWLKGRAGE